MWAIMVHYGARGEIGVLAAAPLTAAFVGRYVQRYVCYSRTSRRGRGEYGDRLGRHSPLRRLRLFCRVCRCFFFVVSSPSPLFHLSLLVTFFASAPSRLIASSRSSSPSSSYFLFFLCVLRRFIALVFWSRCGSLPVRAPAHCICYAMWELSQCVCDPLCFDA